ncbi:hypothetical protein [Aureivirga marina]|uniref:hypothetical protein n=1 Tax=Aureivirga marina TaxID=1182451 RepID=UPI0018C9C1CA|nr:hypothetical protein [Aureivirga marina]
MLNLFNRKKIQIDTISFPTFEFTSENNQPDYKSWLSEDNPMRLSINFFEMQPDIPTINDVQELRNFYREQIIEANGGIIEVEIVDLKGFKAIKTIFKFPMEPSGIMYLGSYTIPFKRYSFVIKIQANEAGITGMRDATIMNNLLAENKTSNDEFIPKNWLNDPYDKNCKKGTMMNLSEDQKYDSDFPNHPLSLTRKMLKKIAEEIKFDSKLENIGKFNI